MKLRDYQIRLSEEGALKLVFYGICYYAMEVRTGKTLTALNCCLVYLHKKQIKSGQVCFITTKKAIKDIQSQAAAINMSNITVINYESIHKLEHYDYDIIVCDEAHKLGAYPKPSNRVKNIKSNFKDAVFIYLSGTPTPESYSQIYHQLYLSNQTPFKEYKSFYKWAANFVDVKRKYVSHGNPVNDYSNANKELIKKNTDHLFIKFTQKDAGFETEIKEQKHSVQMLDITHKIINTIIKDDVFVGKNNTILADTSVKKQSKIHQLFSGTVKFEDGTTAVIDKSKGHYIRDKFKGKKIAIFYKFKAEFDLLKSIFTDFTSDPFDFNEADNLVFLGQIQSVREGINLSTADCLIMYNIDFSAVSYWQGRDRLSEKNRTKDNVVHWIFASEGIENKIYKSVQNKKDYTLEYFKKDYDRTTNTDKNTKVFNGQRSLFS